MSDEQDEVMEVEESETPVKKIRIVTGRKYSATLMNGETFFLGDLRLNKGITVIVSSEQALILQGKHITRSVMNADETFSPLRQYRFLIKEAPTGSVPVKTPVATRVRQRPAE